MKNPRSSCPVEILSIMRMNVAPEFIILTGIVKEYCPNRVTNALFQYHSVRSSFLIRICPVCLAHNSILLFSLMTYHRTRVTQQVPLEKQALLYLPRHTSSHLFLSGLHVSQSLFFLVVLCHSLFVVLFIV